MALPRDPEHWNHRPGRRLHFVPTENLCPTSFTASMFDAPSDLHGQQDAWQQDWVDRKAARGCLSRRVVGDVRQKQEFSYGT